MVRTETLSPKTTNRGLACVQAGQSWDLAAGGHGTDNRLTDAWEFGHRQNLNDHPKSSTFNPISVTLSIDGNIEGLNVRRYHPVITDDNNRIAQLLDGIMT